MEDDPCGVREMPAATGPAFCFAEPPAKHVLAPKGAVIPLTGPASDFDFLTFRRFAFSVLIAPAEIFTPGRAPLEKADKKRRPKGAGLDSSLPNRCNQDGAPSHVISLA